MKAFFKNLTFNSLNVMLVDNDELYIYVSNRKKICYPKSQPFSDEMVSRLKKNDNIAFLERNNDCIKVIDSYYGKTEHLANDEICLKEYLDNLAKDIHFNWKYHDYDYSRRLSYQYDPKVQPKMIPTKSDLIEIINLGHNKYSSTSGYISVKGYIYHNDELHRALLISELPKEGIEIFHREKKVDDHYSRCTALDLNSLDYYNI